MAYTNMPYILRLKNISAHNNPCFYCGDKKCEGCPLPFTDEIIY